MKGLMATMLAVLAAAAVWAGFVRNRGESPERGPSRWEMFSANPSGRGSWSTDWSWDTGLQWEPDGAIRASIRPWGGFALRTTARKCPCVMDGAFLVVELEAEPSAVASLGVSLEDEKGEYPTGGLILRSTACRVWKDERGISHILLPLNVFGQTGRQIRKVNLMSRDGQNVVSILMRRVAIIPSSEAVDAILTRGE